ncbi:MAG: hypothetical protein WCK23_07460 [Actinomycetes bacterium]
MKLNSLVVTTIASTFGLLTIAQIGAERPVFAEPQPCVTYQIEGTIDTPETLSLDQMREAEVYVHFGDKPLVRHQVFASFTGALGEILGEPVLLMTDELGRATVEVLQGAVTVAFMTESPGSENCAANAEVAYEPVIVAATILVQPSVDGPVGLDQGVTYDDIFELTPNTNELGDLGLINPFPTSKSEVSATALAHTGPVSGGVLMLSVVIFGVGIGLAMGRGHQAASVER